MEIALSSKIGEVYNKRENKTIDKNISIKEINFVSISSSEIARYFKSVYNEIKIDLRNLNRSVIIDSHSLKIEDAIKYFSSCCDIYCLGMPNESEENLISMIRKNDTIDDWSYHTGNIMMEIVCQQIINNSKIMQEQCKKHNIKFFDTSGNRKDKITEIIKEIEEKSIYRS